MARFTSSIFTSFAAVAVGCDGGQTKAEPPAPAPQMIHVPHEQGGSVVTSAQFFGELHKLDKPGFRVEQAGDTITLRMARSACDKFIPDMKTAIPNGATVKCVDPSDHAVWIMDR